ncbi:restriction endonuclease subunit S [Lelliottia amnigena]|uniref:restriction endonuclease subunit S n=1 Tax=Lelliottia amnigena TaxID=61646 RepID=UPI00293BB2B4|nr:restriction endonuclease subunit S [Lelliottia amnigena]
MAKYKAYPEYKDSGVEWLGKVPSHWEILSAKRMFQSVRTPSYKSDEQLAASQKYGVIPQSLMMQLNDSKVMLALKGTESFRHVEANNFVISLRSFEGGIEYSQYTGCVSPAYTVLKNSKPISYSYYRYLLKCSPFIAALQSSTDSLRDGKSINYEQFSALSLPISSVQEQNIIATLLDHETAKVDNLIEKQQQLIELLKEKRQAVISHAVTKGLNPDVPMKDSGVEWLGEVPEHWGVTRAKFISKIFVPQRNKPELNSDSGIFWVTMENMSQHYITSSHQRVSDLAASQSGSKILPKGAVIASCVGNFGVAAINKVDVIINQQLQAFQPVNVMADYLLAMVSISKNYFELIGTAATLIYVNKEGFENLPVLVPSESEQISICKFINDNNEKFELLIDHSINQINLLQERRTALISAAVTGKIDVRDWVAPDTQDVEEPQEATA